MGPWLFWISQKLNLIIILWYIEWKKNGLKKLDLIIYLWTCKNIQINKPHKGQEQDMITLRNHLKWSYMKWLPVSLSVLDMIIVQSAAICGWNPGCWFQKSIVCFWPIRKEIVSWMYSNELYSFPCRVKLVILVQSWRTSIVWLILRLFSCGILLRYESLWLFCLISLHLVCSRLYLRPMSILKLM